MKTNWFKRTLCSILALVLVLGYFPVQTIAAESDGLCEHHTQHTTECGYYPAVEAHDCGHEHTDDCYNSVTACVHVHEDCGYVPAVEGHGCDCQPNDSGEIVHTEGCGYVEAAAEVPCSHVCSEETGCVAKVLNCQHQHDAACGYAEASAETPCGFVCEECAKKEAAKNALQEILVESVTITQEEELSEVLVGETLELTAVVLPENATDKTVSWSSSDESIATVDENGVVTGVSEGDVTITASAENKAEDYFLTVKESKYKASELEKSTAVGTVSELINALPTVDDVKAMSMENQIDAYNQIQNAYDAYESLNDEEKALVGNVEIIFAPLFNFFNSFTVAAVDQSSEDGAVAPPLKQWPSSVVSYGYLSSKSYGSDKLPYQTYEDAENTTTTYGTNVKNSHHGTEYYAVDLSGTGATAGTAVYAVAAGEVVDVRYGYGQVTIKHHGLRLNEECYYDTWYSTYVHMDNLSIETTNEKGEPEKKAIAVGDKVSCEQQIGVVGKTGTDNYHLHFSMTTQVRNNGSFHYTDSYVGVSNLENEVLRYAKATINPCWVFPDLIGKVKVAKDKPTANPADIEAEARFGRSAEYAPGTDLNKTLFTKQDPPTDISPESYLDNFAQKATQISRTAVVNGNSANTWKLPWTNSKDGVQDSSLKLGTASGEIKLIREIVNHVGNTWYEYDTGTSTRGFIYSGDVTLKVAEPYYNEISVGTITTDNAFLKAKIQNPSRIKLVSGGVRLGTSLDNLSQEKTFNIPSSYQTNTTIECSYDLKTECGFTLQPGMRYYYQFFVAEDGKQDSPYVSDFRSFDTASVPVSSISLSPSSKTLNIGDTVQLTATISPSNATNKFVHWSSSKSGVASVSSTGLVTAKGAGSAVITATAADDIGKSASTTITVQAEVTSPYYNNNDISVSSITTNNAYLTAIIQNPSCIKLVNGGVRIGTSAGSLTQSKSFDIPTSWQTEAQIDCTYDLKTECGFTLQPGTRYYYQFFVYEEGKPNSPYVSEVRFFDTASIAVSSISLSPTSKALNIGDTVQLTATVSPTNATNKSVTWKSNNTSVATVSSTGLVTAMGEGTAVITVTAADGSGKSASANITAAVPTVVVASGSCGANGDNVTYSLTNKGVLTITGSGKMKDYPNYDSAPWYGEREKITSVVIEKGTTSVGDNSFHFCESLTSVSIPNSVTSIGNGAFSGCKSLASIDIPNSVSSIGYGAFFSCRALTSITIPYGISTISNQMFAYCSGLTSVSIPDSVKTFDFQAFSYCDSLTSITIPAGVTSIGNKAFVYCGSLTSIVIPDGVTSIGASTFWKCTGLRSVTLPAGITSIEQRAFSECGKLRDVYYSGSERQWNAITIGSENDCLTNASLHCSGSDPVTDVIASGTCGANGNNATYTLTDKGVLTITGSGKLKEYSQSATAPWYGNREKITSVVIEEGITSIGNYSFYSCSNLTTVTIPEGVTSIGDYAFCSCANLQTTTIPESVSSVGEWSFAYCKSLASVKIPEGVTSIKTGTFQGCDILASVTLPQSLSSIGVQAFYNCCSLTSISIPQGVTSIGVGAFSNCESLTTFSIPEGVNAIECNTFYGCEKLTSVSIPKSVTSIGGYAFYSCLGLTSVTIPEGVTSIGEYAFRFCRSLTSISIPKNVTSIGESAFHECGALSSIHFLGNGFTEPNLFNKNVTAYYPRGNTTWTKAIRDSFGSYVTWIEVCTNHTEVVDPAKAPTCTENGLTEGKHCSACGIVLVKQEVVLATHQFEDGQCKICGLIVGSCGENLTYTLTSEGELTITGSGAMDDYVGSTSAPWYNRREEIVSVILSEGVTSIGTEAFQNCSNLISVSIPDGITSIGREAFSCCSKLSSVSIPSGVSSISDHCFYSCTKLTSVSIPKGVTQIEDGAFENCSDLTSISLPNSVTSIGDSAFSDCCRLTEISIPSGVTTIGSGAFRACSQLTKITLPSGITTIGEDTFSSCYRLRSIVIPNGVTSIGNDAFRWCGGLKSVTIPNSVITIGSDAFDNCLSLTTITIPENVNYIGDSAFYSSALTEIHFLGDGFQGKSNLFSSPVVAYYSAKNATWTQEIRDSFGTKVTWRDSSENYLVLNDSELIKETQIWVDGVSYPVKKDSAGSYVNIPDNTSPVLVTYSYNNSSDDAHTQYPVGMQAYRIHQTETGATVERLPELDNLLQYSGSSIRIVGKKGIRMITSVNQDTRNSLTGNGLAGFKLLEYGTLLAQTSKLGDNPLVLGGGEYVKSNYAYKKGVADPVFKYANGLIQYTNVLIGFTDEQCKEDIAMRPYMKLLDENGEEFVIYGGIVYRSIGYIAYQNRNAFQPGSAAYEYVWSIIHNVYGTKYDSEYRK